MAMVVNGHTGKCAALQLKRRPQHNCIKYSLSAPSPPGLADASGTPVHTRSVQAATAAQFLTGTHTIIFLLTISMSVD